MKQATNTKKFRIFCVDDDNDTCELMKVWLEFAPGEYDVELVEARDEALTRIGKSNVDLYVLDSSVSGYDDLTLLQTIRQLDKTTPILVFSGMAQRIDRDEAMKAGASEYLTKPADSEEFIAAIERLLHRGTSTG